MTYLNLDEHDIDEITGKLVSLNGTDYVFGKMIGEGGEGFVFPLMNRQSCLYYFAAKLEKFRKGSEQYEERKNRLPVTFRQLSCAQVSAIISDGSEIPIVISEVYEICGGLFQIMPLLAPAEPALEDKYCRHEMERAIGYTGAGQIDKAIPQYRIILDKNPDHTYALINLASCYLGTGKPDEAITLARRAVEIEPNEAKSTQAAAQICFSAGDPDLAITLLQKTLDRYKWDAPSIHLQNKIAWIAARPEIISRNIALLKEFGKGTAEELIQYYEKNFQSTHYLDSLPEPSPANLQEQLNACIRQYHEGIFRETLDRLFNLFPSLRQLPPEKEYIQINTTFILIVLCGFSLEMHDLCCHYMAQLAASYDNPFDLPGIPTEVLNNAVVEKRDVDKILAILKHILTICQKDEKPLLQKAQRLYKEYNKALKGSGEEGAKAEEDENIESEEDDIGMEEEEEKEGEDREEGDRREDKA